jgi:acyl-CoA synthetase (AMP-forming)/AMP-acid ligase II
MGMSMMLYPSDHEKGLRDHPQILSSAGRPLSCVDIRVVDDDGNDVPDGETGELLIKSDFVILGYWNRPEEYAKTVKDGWLYTGDMGRLDKDGYVYLGDRAKFRIKTGGYNVFPTEVENVLAEHPAVLEVSVVGLPDPKWGERIHAVVSLRSGAEASGDALREFCRGKIADFKVPKSIDIWPEIPKGVTGKILKRQIIDHYL